MLAWEFCLLLITGQKTIKKQNEQYKEAMRRLGYDKTNWQWRYGHDHLPKQSLGFKDLLKFLENLFGGK
ncbi:MAG: hypothetical protein IJC07_03680 [Clostridia bacterium]|nr:hypothetical protein [Clostridia bacterium]